MPAILRLPAFPSRILLQVLFATVLPFGLLALGKVAPAGRLFWLLFGLLLLRLVALGRPLETLALILALVPAMNFLRDYATYNIIIVLLAAALLFCFFRSPGSVWAVVRRFPILPGLVLYAGVYNALTFINTRDYSMNLRAFELVFAVTGVLLLARRQAMLASVFLGLTVAALGIGAAMLPNYFGLQSATRLGMVMIDDVLLGNPAQLGLALALGFLALTLDRGQWMNLERKPVWRIGLLAAVVVLLALTTSRASWTVAIGGLAAGILIGRRQRGLLLVVIAAVAVGVYLLLASPWGSFFQRGLERTFSQERSIGQRTSGRTDQWRVAYHAFNRSPRTQLIGHGPGNGPALYARYSQQLEGITYAVGRKSSLHSLFMQVGVETGALGLGLVLALLAFVFRKTLKWTRHHHAVFPFAAFLGYCLMVMTVSGNDAVSGMLLGMGVCCTARITRLRRPQMNLLRQT